MKLQYPLQYNRRQTREVLVGNIGIGGKNPIRLQSMLTCATTDVETCLQEIRELNQVQCEMIRLTIPTRKDLDSIPEIRRQMAEEGIVIPLIADIHFKPKLAVDACEVFEKVRINPGNYSDKPKNSRVVGDLAAFEEGKEKIRELIFPLVENLKKYNCALRIGVNHGSLSTRMMEQFGDSPLGMVESALEMVELFEEQDFQQTVISLKSSNPLVVQKAYRLLVQKLPSNNSIPLHLGVTEAGAGEMARIKSLAGIGTLLSDGIGDTIRVSLTEPSHREIVFAKEFMKSFPAIQTSSKVSPIKLEEKQEALELSLENHRFKNGSISWNKTQIGGASPLKLGVPQGEILVQNSMGVKEDFYFEDSENKLWLREDNLTQKHDFSQYEAIIFDFIDPVFSVRKFFREQEKQLELPCGVQVQFEEENKFFILAQLATLLSEGYLDFLLLPSKINTEDLTPILYLLQATRTRLFITDYISCPSCGRTLFDLQTTTEKIKQATDHLKGLKIAVMGCIVNGPGEMADADVGYVGSGRGKIDLYLKKQKIRKKH